MARFNRNARPASDAKLAELILYIADRMTTDPNFGDTKLNKVLFYADFSAYARLGEPITGHKYQKQVWGPVIPALRRVRHRMELHEPPEVAVRKTDKLLRIPTMTIPLRDANISIFSADEISIVDEMIEYVRPHSAREISDLSHNFEGWRALEIGDELPYETVFLVNRPLTREEEEWAAQLEPSIASG